MTMHNIIVVRKSITATFSVDQNMTLPSRASMTRYPRYARWSLNFPSARIIRGGRHLFCDPSPGKHCRGNDNQRIFTPFLKKLRNFQFDGFFHSPWCADSHPNDVAAAARE